jgi:hypothetical protein
MWSIDTDRAAEYRSTLKVDFRRLKYFAVFGLCLGSVWALLGLGGRGPPAPREATFATTRTDSTTTGAPALEPEAADWNRANDHLKKKQGLTAEEDAAARSCAALADTARLRGQRRDRIRLRLPAQDQAHARPPRDNPAAARARIGVPRAELPPFLRVCCLETPPFSSKMQGSHAVAAAMRDSAGSFARSTTTSTCWSRVNLELGRWVRLEPTGRVTTRPVSCRIPD